MSAFPNDIFSAVRAPRVSDEIVRQIRDALFAGKLRAGDRLPAERELAADFASSRTSVREALRRLEQQGVIQVKKGASGGTFVVDMDHRPVAQSLETLLQLKKISIHQIAEVRLIFEPETARLAAQRASWQDLRDLEDTIRKMSAALEDGKAPTSYDLRFHMLLARAAGNPILQMVAESMLAVASKAITELNPAPETVRQVLACHRAILEAVREGDGEHAYQAMREHVMDVQARLARQASTYRELV